ncbi:MAG: membrane protein insertion efficiency factor YidD [Ruminococcaceae bacterium]|nr:membrane protein insertion efficiency factor YidD [Oscillospiraceae bacterium]
MKYVFIALIRFYQKFLSPLKKQPTCRFVPTCSNYCLTAFQKRGFFVGLFLSVGRLLRCQPLCAGGWDPVPERGFNSRKYRPTPMTKYYFPQEYGFIREEPTGDRENQRS